MMQIDGVYWPDYATAHDRDSALAHVSVLDEAIALCPQHQTAVQAGGNVGLWPRRLAEVFQRVITFEPHTESRECLTVNVPESVEVHTEALGMFASRGRMQSHKLGQHTLESGDEVSIIPLDALHLTDVDLMQFDIEGYEWFALYGAVDTIRRCSPVIQVELKRHGARYGMTDTQVETFLEVLGYTRAATVDRDVVFARAA